jgi:hypothetical protein
MDRGSGQQEALVFEPTLQIKLSPDKKEALPAVKCGKGLETVEMSYVVSIAGVQRY